MSPAPRLGTNHHTFLQAVMKRGPLSEKATMGMYKSLVLSTGEGFVQFLLAINKELEFVRLEVKKVMNQYDGQEFYGVINTLPSKEAKLGTQFTQAQILFFKAVMEAIVQEPTASGVIPSMKTMYLKVEPQQGDSQDANTQISPIKLSMQAREEALSLLVAEQLLSRTDGGGVGLGVKAFLELRSVFRNLEVPFCEICNEAAIKAQLCSTRDCSKRVHEYCLARGSQSRNQRPKCSGCRSEWAQPVQSEGPGDEEQIEDEEYTEPIATQELVQISKKPRISRKRSAATSDDEEVEHLEENEHDEEQDRRTSQKPRTSRRKRSAAISDDEEDEHLDGDGHDVDQDRRTSHQPRTSSRKRSAATSDDEEDEHLEENGHDVDQDRRRSPKPRTSRRKRSAATSDDEQDEGLEENGHDGDQGKKYFRRTRSSRGLGT